MGSRASASGVILGSVKLLGCLLPALAALACGGLVGPDHIPDMGSGAAAGTSGSGGVASGADAAPEPGAGAEPGAGGSGTRYVDPGCPPAPKVQGPRECDPYSTTNTCGVGARCVPYVTYGDQCQSEEIGTRCAPAGTGVQGDDCANDGDSCAAGYVCASAGSGFRCARLCTLSGASDDCPPGLLCSALDVDGFFVCG